MTPDAQDYPITWRPIAGFEKYYRISNNGQIYSKRRGGLLNPSLAPNGYLTTALYGKKDSGQQRHVGVHRLVAEHFVPNPEGLPEVDHEDNNRSNNWFWNLMWVTHVQNVRYSFERGTRKQNGEDNHKARLTVEDVLAIRAAYTPRIRQGWTEMMAAKYGVQPAAISKICKRRTWRHLP